MQLKIIAAKYGLVVGLGLTASHYFAQGVLIVEDSINGAVSEAKAQVVDTLATQAGYVLPEVDADGAKKIAIREANRRGISPTLVLALMHVESGTKTNVSPVGALGHLQVMPFNAKRCNIQPKELLQPDKNIQCGVQILAEDLIAEKMNINRALQRYNGGPKCVNRCAESIRHARMVEEKKNQIEKAL
mgnify:CR=1 FL=1